MRLAIFIVILALYFYYKPSVLAQSADNPIVIELSATDFVIDRSFTISVLVRGSENRPAISFPDVPGLTKQGTSYSSTRVEISGQEVVNQVVVQTYAATRPGVVVLAPFAVTVNGQTVRSPGARLTVRPSPAATNPASATAAVLAKAKADKQAAFLRTTVSQTRLYTGQGLHVGVSFWVAESYPYEIRFDRLAEQVEAMVRQLRPVNAWEENSNISEARPRPAVLNGRRYVEYPLYSAVFFPLAARTGAPRTIALPAVALTVLRRTPTPSVPGSQTNRATAAPASPSERVAFVSQPITVAVQPLPARAGATGPVAVGTFRLTDDADYSRVAVGQSIRYDLRIEGQGNIAGIQAPQLVSRGGDLDVFPPQAQEQLSLTGGVVSGYKSFRYFLIPKQKGTLPLADRFFWVYFDPQTARYDTLRPQTTLRVGEAADSAISGIVPSDTLDQAGRPSIYAGLEQTDSTEQTINWPVLIRAIANVLIIIMILGTLVVFARK